VLESAPWETVVGWLGLLLRMGTEVIGVVHGDAQMFVLKSCSIVLSRSSEQAEQHKDGNGMTPRELVLWVGMSLSDHLRRVLGQCEDVDDKCAESVPWIISTLLGVLSLLSNGQSDLGSAMCLAFHELQGEVLGLLQGYLDPAQPAWIQRAVVESLRGLCQETNTRYNGKDKASAEWVNTCVRRLGPSIAGIVHRCLTETRRALNAEEVQIVAEALKLFLLSISLFEAKGMEAQTAIINVLLPLLIEAVDPSGMPNAALIAMSLKLINIMNAAALAAPFRAVVSSLPPVLKQRLQKVLRAATAPKDEKPVSQSARLPDSSRPSIILKTNFATPS